MRKRDVRKKKSVAVKIREAYPAIVTALCGELSRPESAAKCRLITSDLSPRNPWMTASLRARAQLRRARNSAYPRPHRFHEWKHHLHRESNGSRPFPTMTVRLGTTIFSFLSVFLFFTTIFSLNFVFFSDFP